MNSDILAQIERIAVEVKKALADGNKVLFCGNGGSAADSQHLAAEFVGRFQKERARSACYRTDCRYLHSDCCRQRLRL